MVSFVGAGPGAEDLITVRGSKLLQQADVVIYAGSLVNKELLNLCKDNCEIHNSAVMTLEEVIKVISEAEKSGKNIVRLHTGDPCLYGAIREQMDALSSLHIEYEVVPGVSSFCGAAAALNLEYTLPDVSQSVIITRMEGRTPVPEKESIESFSSHGSTMVIFLSAGMLDKLQSRLIAGGYSPDTPAAIVYKASWNDEKKVLCTVGNLAQSAVKNDISKTALIIVGNVVAQSCGGNESMYSRSKLYDPDFTTGWREGLHGRS
ncbi:MAG: precorrin-4 C(11)-methyltransferase [Treponema sp.]|nr:precorrin-4 C(11)-methyltransferase [Treponema sp.]